jgi:hypothetical protein
MLYIPLFMREVVEENAIQKLLGVLCNPQDAFSLLKYLNIAAFHDGITLQKFLLHLALQPWVSLGPLYNQSPLFSIPHLLFPSFHLHPSNVFHLSDVGC